VKQDGLDKEYELDMRALLEACCNSDVAMENAATRKFFECLLKHLSSHSFNSPPDRLAEPDVWKEIPHETSTSVIGRRMLQFDALADHLQKLHHRHLMVTAYGVLLFLCGFELHAHWFDGQAWVLILALAFLGISFGVVFVLESRTVQLAYLSTRTTAEILRIWFFLDGSGQDFPTDAWVPRRYGPAMKSILAIRNQIAGEIVGKPRAQLSEAVVKQAWFEGQKSFFKSAKKKAEKRHRAWESVSGVTFALAIVGMAVLVAISLLGDPTSRLAHGLLVLAPSLLGVAAMCQFFLERRGFKANARRYEDSHLIFEIPAGLSWHNAVTNAGSEALNEVVDWYVASVEREIKVPSG
jgi:hypothetical protein